MKFWFEGPKTFQGAEYCFSRDTKVQYKVTEVTTGGNIMLKRREGKPRNKKINYAINKINKVVPVLN
jgi:hypothetical protein